MICGSQTLLRCGMSGVQFLATHPTLVGMVAVAASSAMSYWLWHSCFFLRQRLKTAADSNGMVLKDKEGKVTKYPKFTFVRDASRRIVRIEIEVPRGVTRSTVQAFHEVLVSVTALELLQLENIPGKSVNHYQAVRESVGE